MTQPKFEGIDNVYKTKADNKDIRDLLEKLVPKASSQMVDFSKRFKGNTDEQTCKNIFNYLINNFTYVADGEEQIIKLPSALLKKKVGDCKSYSLFTASILENLGIPYSFIYASYNSNPIPGHVYVVTKKGCIIDAVYGKFNQEKTPIYKYKKNMNVRYMAGIGCASCGGTCGNKKIGNIFTDAAASIKAKAAQAENAAKAARDKAAKAAADAQASIKAKAAQAQSKITQGTKTIGLSSGRNLFLILVKNNIDGFASKLANTNTTPLLNQWYKIGGDRTILANAIRVGSSKPERKFGLLGKLKTILKSGNVNSSNINGIGAIPSGVKSAIVAACTAAGTAISSATTGALAAPIGAGSGATLGEVINQVLPMIIDAVNKVPTTEEVAANAVLNANAVSNIDTTAQDTTDNSAPKESSNTLLYVGGAALLLGGVYFATKK